LYAILCLSPCVGEGSFAENIIDMSFDILTNHGRTVSHWGVDDADVLE
jgi:hypothetical protein